MAGGQVASGLKPVIISQIAMQGVDYTTLMAVVADLKSHWLPARVEKVYQRDRHTILLALRTIDQRGWLTISWHPQAARPHTSQPPPRSPDTFTFSQQLHHQLQGLALVAIAPIAPWERALDLQFAPRPSDPVQWHLYVEIMGKYSNAILVNPDNVIVTAAHQVSSQQSRLRPIQTGTAYEVPPRLTEPIPSLTEPQEQWQERLALIPGTLRKNLLKTYRGLSSPLVDAMVRSATIDPQALTDHLSPDAWQRLFQQWQWWLRTLAEQTFQPGYTSTGYTVVGWELQQPNHDVQGLLDGYYSDRLSQQQFQQLHHQLSQRLNSLLTKLQVKAQGFQQRLTQADHADRCREQADLLMAHLHRWQPGMTDITLPDFTTGEPQTISLHPEKNAVQNAQVLYKQHQKLRRAREAIAPLLAAVQEEIHYLEQVEAALTQLDCYHHHHDLITLEEIRDELVQQGYLEDPGYQPRRSPQESAAEFHHYRTPSGFDLYVGRNNRQNDHLTFRVAQAYDLWFHTQEIPGSHVLLRPNPGAEITTADLQYAADLTAYHSRARHSDQVPIVYTTPNHVYKPKGAKPGIAIYKQETVIWGQPHRRYADSAPNGSAIR